MATAEVAMPFPIVGQEAVPAGLTAVRRTLSENTRRLAEMEQVVRTMDEEFQRMRRSTLVRAAAHLARRWDRLRGKGGRRNLPTNGPIRLSHVGDELRWLKVLILARECRAINHHSVDSYFYVDESEAKLLDCAAHSVRIWFMTVCRPVILRPKCEIKIAFQVSPIDYRRV